MLTNYLHPYKPPVNSQAIQDDTFTRKYWDRDNEYDHYDASNPRFRPMGSEWNREGGTISWLRLELVNPNLQIYAVQKIEAKGNRGKYGRVAVILCTCRINVSWVNLNVG